MYPLIVFYDILETNTTCFSESIIQVVYYKYEMINERRSLVAYVMNIIRFV